MAEGFIELILKVRGIIMEEGFIELILMEEGFIELILKIGLWTLGGILSLMILWELKWFILFCAFVGGVAFVLWDMPT